MKNGIISAFRVTFFVAQNLHKARLNQRKRLLSSGISTLVCQIIGLSAPCPGDEQV